MPNKSGDLEGVRWAEGKSKGLSHEGLVLGGFNFKSNPLVQVWKLDEDFRL